VFALDANALIHALKGIGQVRQAIEGTSPTDLAVPAVVAYKLEVGTLRSRNPAARRRELNRLLTVLTVLPFDRQAADRAARVRFDLERKGAQIGPLDTLIAGTVLAHGATLVTHNTEEFSRIPGLQVEDWY
jgi:tRNA(fMet)-specific endonuclease VapC